MKFYDKYFASNYDELITYYPRFYRDVYEMTEILKAHGRVADELEANIEQTFFNASIDCADEAAITRLEAFLHICSTKGKTLEERKRFLKSFLIGFGKISASLICQMISAYTNAPVSCRFEPADSEGNNKLFIIFDRGKHAEIYLADIGALILKKIPAHICYSIIMDMVPDKPLELTVGVKACGISKRVQSVAEQDDTSIFAIRTTFRAGFAVGGIHKKIRAEVKEHGMEQRGTYRQRA